MEVWCFSLQLRRSTSAVRGSMFNTSTVKMQLFSSENSQSLDFYISNCLPIARLTSFFLTKNTETGLGNFFICLIRIFTEFPAILEFLVVHICKDSTSCGWVQSCQSLSNSTNNQHVLLATYQRSALRTHLCPLTY